MPENIRLRFAPSPTGYVHIGSLRTVLFTYLIAKNLNGTLILRIEDTDEKREVEGAVDNLIKVLSWMGIEFDEGPHVGGDYGPYIQSQRVATYDKYKEQLLESDKAYRCFCTEQDLEEMRKDQEARKLPPRYDRRCRHLTPGQIKAHLDKGDKFVVRHKIPESGEVAVHDELRGDIKFNLADLDDYVLIKSNGMPTYQFANVVDDHLMEISHVTRGDEWISSYPKNYLLYQDFGWTPPKFVHYSLVLDKSGGKLSKRKGNVAVEEFIKDGYLKEALINFCALLGWHPKGDQEIYTIDELAKLFTIDNLRVSSPIFDTDKLDYFNGYYIRQKPIDELAVQCLPYLTSSQIPDDLSEESKLEINGQSYTFGYIRNVVRLEQERLKKLSEITEKTKYFFTPELSVNPDMLIWKKLTREEVANNLKFLEGQLNLVPANEWTHHSIRDTIMTKLQAMGYKNGDYLWPMRVALTGEQFSPTPFEVAEVLGKSTTLHRINQAIASLSQ